MRRFRRRHRTFRLSHPKPRNENKIPELTARNVAHPPRLAPHDGANNASNPRSPNRIPPSASRYHAIRAARLSGHNPASCSLLRIVGEDHITYDPIVLVLMTILRPPQRSPIIDSGAARPGSTLPSSKFYRAAQARPASTEVHFGLREDLSNPPRTRSITNAVILRGSFVRLGVLRGKGG